MTEPFHNKHAPYRVEWRHGHDPYAPLPGADKTAVELAEELIHAELETACQDGPPRCPFEIEVDFEGCECIPIVCHHLKGLSAHLQRVEVKDSYRDNRILAEYVVRFSP